MREEQGRGCRSARTYCVIKKAQGSLKSRPLPTIIADVSRLIASGKKYIRLVSSDCGCYGQDIDSDIVELLKQIFELPGEYKILLKDFNPKWLIEYKAQLLPLFREHQTKVQVLEVPLQSGSQKIISKMRRNHDIAEAIDTLTLLKEEAESIRITTQLMVGFPSETYQDFRSTKRLLSSGLFYHVTCYSFDPRNGTSASDMKEQVPDRIKRRRFNCLHYEATKIDYVNARKDKIRYLI